MVICPFAACVTMVITFMSPLSPCAPSISSICIRRDLPGTKRISTPATGRPNLQSSLYQFILLKLINLGIRPLSRLSKSCAGKGLSLRGRDRWPFPEGANPHPTSDEPSTVLPLPMTYFPASGGNSGGDADRAYEWLLSHGAVFDFWNKVPRVPRDPSTLYI